ncbi:MAG TPA: sensor histidine kinase, partial [Polyangia bacterium]
MAVPLTAEPISPARINFGWLIRLRFATVVGQALTIAAVRWGMDLEIPIAPLYALVGLSLVSNLGGIAYARVAIPQDWWLLCAMAFDVLTFSGLLYLTGGPENPFSFLYLVPIAIAAITLRPAWTWMLVLLSLASSAVLFARHRPLPMAGGHAGHMVLHLRGMWVAFGVASAFIVYFLLRVRRALAARDRELDASRNLAARQERLASLATLAAGAAHELATPLSTIAIVAKDLERAVATGGSPATVEDVRLMRQEVERCRQILARMRTDAGDQAGERFVRVSVRELVADCLGDGSLGDGSLGDGSPGDGSINIALDDRARQKDAQAHPLAGGLGGEERLTHPTEDLRRDAAAMVRDLEDQPARVVCRHPQRHRRARGRGLARVVEQAAQRLRDRVAGQGGRAGR